MFALLRTPPFRAAAMLAGGFAAAILLTGNHPAAAQTTIIERPGYLDEHPGYLALPPSQRIVIRRYVIHEPPVAVPRVELRVGTPVPRAVELHRFPEEAYVEVPALRRYRYFRMHDEIVVVDPATNETIEIIRD